MLFVGGERNWTVDISDQATDVSNCSIIRDPRQDSQIGRICHVPSSPFSQGGCSDV